MAENSKGTILQSLQEIGRLVSARIQEKAADSPLVASIAQGAAARVRSAVQAPRGAAPAEVVSVTDREPDAHEEPASLRETIVSHGVKVVTAAIPQVVHLLWKLTTDPRVPLKNKLILGAAAAYLFSPLDIIPDRIAGAGQIDDFAVVVTALDIVLNQTPDDIVRSHWTGDPRTLDNIRRVVGVASQLRGGKARRWLQRAES